MGAKAILTEADRNEAVRLALAGGNPVEFLRTKGLKDPKSSWANIKSAVKASNPELYEKTIRDIPLGRFADPVEDIGRTCVFLASKDASFISGETITIQGGSGLRP